MMITEKEIIFTKANHCYSNVDVSISLKDPDEMQLESSQTRQRS